MEMRTFCTLLLTTTTVSFCACLSGNTSEESHLIRHVLMNNYDPLARPVQNSSQPVELTVSLGLKYLVQLDMKTQALVIFVWLVVSWHDPFLSWDVDRYPVSYVLLSPDMVWLPDLVIPNAIHDLDQLQNQKGKVLVTNAGRVHWFPGGLFRTFCSIRILFYPFDSQTCSLQVMSWAYTGDLLNVSLGDPTFESRDGEEDHPEWKLTSRTARYSPWPQYHPRLTFTFTLERRALFYVFNMVLPVVLLSLVNCLVFVLPPSSGEKMTVSVTVFLAFTVFLSVINGSLPPNSDSPCLFSLYVAVHMVLSVGAIVSAAFITFMNDNDNDANDNDGSFCTCHAQHSHLSECTPRNSGESRTRSSNRPDHLRLASYQGEGSAQQTVNGRPEAILGLTAKSPREQDQADSSATIGLGKLGWPTKQQQQGINAMNTKKEGRDWGQGRRAGQSSVSVVQLWRLCRKGRQRMSAEDRREVCRHLDRVCLKLVLFINTVTGLVFAALWVFAS